MTTASELSRLSLTIKVIGMLEARHPDMPMRAALPIITDLVVLALTDGDCEGSLESAALKAWSMPTVQDQLPPWRN